MWITGIKCKLHSSTTIASQQKISWTFHEKLNHFSNTDNFLNQWRNKSRYLSSIDDITIIFSCLWPQNPIQHFYWSNNKDFSRKYLPVVYWTNILCIEHHWFAGSLPVPTLNIKSLFRKFLTLLSMIYIKWIHRKTLLMWGKYHIISLFAGYIHLQA